ncbi:MAG: bifunctional 3-deoxy-7-phosphoheptulonate synthase/chorismate mutase type II [Bacteroidota bacterium]
MLDKHLKIIAGPCSAETPSQVRQIAESLSGMDLYAFRAGIWKPRTQPGAFEGAGVEGLSWLKDTCDEFGFSPITEVASTAHVEAVLKAGFDKVWIGARSTSNPFSVQELADALQGTSTTVLIKNPTNPDVKLWIGGIERLYKAGIKEVIAVHRGFSTYDKQHYRNLPNWQLPIALRQAFPHVELLCDPSHITGKADNVPMVAQMAVDLKYDGLMVEVHSNPEHAWTDAEQQITPWHLKQLLSNLKYRSRLELDKDELRGLRAELSVLDEQLIRLLAKRMGISEAIGHYKNTHQLAIFQTTQWEESLTKFLQMAGEMEISPEFAKELFTLIHQESI